jgi:Tfp pilus assembly protein PilN
MSGILINLLPDVRQAKLREHRRRQLATGLSITTWAVCGGILVVLTLYVAGQKVLINSLSSNISSKENQLKSIPNLTDALTAQQHSASLSSLYGQRVYMTKFFQAYVASSPTTVTIGSLSVDSQNNLVVNGTATNYAAVAKLARALEAANVTLGNGASASNTPYFSGVSITSVGSVAGGVGFSLSAVLGTGVVSGSN